MAHATISLRRGRFFGRFRDAAGEWCSVPLVATDIRQAMADARTVATICECVRFKLPSPVEAPPEPAVYFAATRHGDQLVVKIGAAQDVNERVEQLQAGSAPVVLVAWRGGGTAEEREEHHRWANFRIRGGWFRLAPELQSYLARLRGFTLGLNC